MNCETSIFQLAKKYRILAGPNEWQQVDNRSNREKTGSSCEGADLSWLSSKLKPPGPWLVLNNPVVGR